MDLRDLVKLAGIVNPELLNNIETTAEVEEADAAGFDKATTRPDEEVMDDPMATMGSDADLSLRRYLKARGDHVTVDEHVYPDYTVEDVNEAYASFKEGKYKSDAQRKAVHAAKAEESVDEAAMSDEEKERAMRRAMQAADEPERGEKKKKVSLKKAPWEESVDDDRDELTKKLFPRYSREEWEKRQEDRNRAWTQKQYMKPGKPSRSREWGAYEGVNEAEEGTYMKQWYNYSEDYAILELYIDGKLVDKWDDYFGANETGNPLAVKFIKMAKENGVDPIGLKVIDGEDGDEGVFTSNGLKWNSNEADIDENAFNHAAAAAARAGKDSFEFGGKTHKTTMKKDVAHKLDDDVDMLRKLAGLA